jgi:hypothetical protein
MKNKHIRIPAMLLLLTGLLFSTLQSCKKYPEDPLISFRTRTERVSNRWQVENYKINGADYTSTLSDYTETFTNDGNYSYNWGSLGGSGTWSFQNDDKEIKMDGSDIRSSRTLYILKLEEKSFWYYHMDGSDKHEFHLIPN